METLSSRMLITAQSHLERPAIIEDGRVLSYKDLLQATRQIASRLIECGVEPGNHIALVLPNGAWFVSSFFAVAHVGGVVAPLNPSLQELEIASIIRDARVSLVLTVKALAERCRRALDSATHGEGVVIALDDFVSPHPDSQSLASWPDEQAQPDKPVLCLYSSGSTGKPKRIERSHRNLLWETDRLAKALQFSPLDRVLGVAPFSHTNGLLRSMVASVLSGATLVTLAEYERLAVAQLIDEQAIGVFIGVPFMFAILAQTRWPKPLDFSSLRICVSSSAPLRPETYFQFQKRYGIPVRQLYGTTETGSISVNLSSRPGESIDSVGMPLEGVAVEIFSEDRRVLGPEEVGEIGIKSLAAASQYQGLPEQSAKSFMNGYFFPGDIGRKDTQGRIYLLGRKTLFINRGGYKVNPYEIEDLIQRHPKVQEAVVLGVGTEYGDQKIKAVIVTVEPCQEREIIEFCRGQIADFKIPSVVEFRAELPKSSTGKILRASL